MSKQLVNFHAFRAPKNVNFRGHFSGPEIGQKRAQKSVQEGYLPDAKKCKFWQKNAKKRVFRQQVKAHPRPKCPPNNTLISNPPRKFLREG